MKPPLSQKIEGFDYLEGEKIVLTRREWNKKLDYIKRNGGQVRTQWFLGETFAYLPAKPKIPGTETKERELIFEIYDTGFERSGK